MYHYLFLLVTSVHLCSYVFRVLGSITQNVLLRVSYFGEVPYKMCSYVFHVLGKYHTKRALMCFMFWGSIAQMCSYVFCVLGKYRINALLGVSCFGEVSQKCGIRFVFLRSITNVTYAECSRAVLYVVLPTFGTHVHTYIAAYSRLPMRSCSLDMQITTYTASLTSMHDASPRCVT
jgi:hypothetical protein